jgi:hypothetical protein
MHGSFFSFLSFTSEILLNYCVEGNLIHPKRTVKSLVYSYLNEKLPIWYFGPRQELVLQLHKEIYFKG